MLEMTFSEFEKYAKVCGNDSPHDIYIISDAEQKLYIGITRDHIVNRWFGSLGHMPYNLPSCFFSSIGRRIADNKPLSGSYTVTLLSLEEGREIVREEIDPNYTLSRVGLEEVEKLLIYKYEPLDNYIHNLEVPQLSRKFTLSIAAWREEFYDEPMPYYKRDVYARLKCNNWQWKNQAWHRLTPLALDAACSVQSDGQERDAAQVKLVR